MILQIGTQVRLIDNTDVLVDVGTEGIIKEYLFDIFYIVEFEVEDDRERITQIVQEHQIEDITVESDTEAVDPR